jgi:hypothetical protein
LSADRPSIFGEYQVRGEDPNFLRTSQIVLQGVAEGYEDDEAV